MDCSPSGSSVRGIAQARILECVAIPFSRGSSQPRDQIQVSCIAGGFFTIWATKARNSMYHWKKSACKWTWVLPTHAIQGRVSCTLTRIPTSCRRHLLHVYLKRSTPFCVKSRCQKCAIQKSAVKNEPPLPHPHLSPLGGSAEGRSVQGKTCKEPRSNQSSPRTSAWGPRDRI